MKVQEEAASCPQGWLMGLGRLESCVKANSPYTISFQTNTQHVYLKLLLYP